MSHAVERVSRAVTWLRIKLPFLHSVLRRLSIEVVDEERDAPVWTDCRKVYVCREFAERARLTKLAGYVLHCAIHVALMHCDARRRSYVGTWNIATDVVVNRFLKMLSDRLGIDLVPEKLPSDAVIAERLGMDVEEVRRLSAEELYFLLLRRNVREKDAHDIVPIGEGGGCGCCSAEGSSAGPAPSEPEQKPSSGPSSRSPIEKQSLQSSARGRVAPSASDLLTSLTLLGRFLGLSGSALMEISVSLGTLPRTDWRRVLRARVVKSLTAGRRYTWLRESRRLGEDAMGVMKLPKPRFRVIYVLIDVSGSVMAEQKLLEDFMGEVVNIARQLRALIHTILWDTEVVGESEFDHSIAPSTVVKWLSEARARGGGGTVIDAALERAIEDAKSRRRIAAAMVVLTDGELALKNKSLAQEAKRIFSLPLIVYTIKDPKIGFEAVPYSAIRR